MEGKSDIISLFVSVFLLLFMVFVSRHRLQTNDGRHFETFWVDWKTNDDPPF
jgi:hypothetical protein